MLRSHRALRHFGTTVAHRVTHARPARVCNCRVENHRELRRCPQRHRGRELPTPTTAYDVCRAVRVHPSRDQKRELNGPEEEEDKIAGVVEVQEARLSSPAVEDREKAHGYVVEPPHCYNPRVAAAKEGHEAVVRRSSAYSGRRVEALRQRAHDDHHSQIEDERLSGCGPVDVRHGERIREGTIVVLYPLLAENWHAEEWKHRVRRRRFFVCVLIPVRARVLRHSFSEGFAHEL